MRNTNHVILQFSGKQKVNTNWLSALLQEKTTLLCAEAMLAPLRFTGKKATIGCQQVFSTESQAVFLDGHSTNSPLRSLRKFFISRVLYSPSTLLTKRVLLSTNAVRTPLSQKDNMSFSLLTVNFLKKERLYTKLKYSRSPAYDIVSGGSAALLAGFIGFLIQEKYGFELVDSGDFYYLFMYAVFFAFSFRPLLISIDLKQNFSQLVSLRIFRDFYLTVLYLFFYNFKS